MEARRKTPRATNQYVRLCSLLGFLATGPRTIAEMMEHLGMVKGSTAYATLRRMLNALDAAGMARPVGRRQKKGQGLSPTLYGLTNWTMRELPVNELRCVRGEDEGDRNAGAAGRLVCANAVLPDVSEVVPDQGDHRRA